MLKNSNLINKEYLSTGNIFLDKITGGLCAGSIVLFKEDCPSKLTDTFIKYLAAEGLVKTEKLLFLSPSVTIKSLITSLPYKSSQVESLLDSKKVSDAKKSEIKIAWRYENIKYSHLLSDMIKNSEYIFDLNREIQPEYLIDGNPSFVRLTARNSASQIDEINARIVKEYKNWYRTSEGNPVKTRIFALNLFSNCDEESQTSELKLKLQSLKALARSLNGIVILSLNTDNCTSKEAKLLQMYSDYVFKVRSFVVDTEAIEGYSGVLNIEKMARINGMATVAVETDVYGLVLEKRKLVVEKVDIGPEIDRNTKVKEKDVTASQVICGHGDETKDFEF